MAHSKSIVLYVEDEEIDRFLMNRAFEKGGLGAVVRMVNDGRTAIDYLSGVGAYQDREKHPLPAVVLLDLNLPEVHGFDVLQWIRGSAQHQQLPVVVFSSSEREEDQHRAKLLGANEFIQKPGSGAQFGLVVRKLEETWLQPA